MEKLTINVTFINANVITLKEKKKPRWRRLRSAVRATFRTRVCLSFRS